MKPLSTDARYILGSFVFLFFIIAFSSLFSREKFYIFEYKTVFVANEDIKSSSSKYGLVKSFQNREHIFNLIQKRTPVGAEATVVIVGLSEISSKRYYSMMGNKKLKIIEIREN